VAGAHEQQVDRVGVAEHVVRLVEHEEGEGVAELGEYQTEVAALFGVLLGLGVPVGVRQVDDVLLESQQ